MRLLHTADWHLGHVLHEVEREEEHALFLAWLLDSLVEHRVDALLLAGDVFDASNPPARALAQWYGFLAEARRRLPRLQVVAIAGNHDSPARLAAPAPLLAALEVRVIGRAGPGLDDLLVPLRDAEGKTAARVLAVPHLRPSDLPAHDSEPEAVRARLAELALRARAQAGPDEALVLLAHAHLQGSSGGTQSERRLLVGGLEGLPPAVLPEGLAYVALGHLHLAQAIGRPSVRYAGSPLPLGLDERTYPHQVCLVELGGPRLEALSPLRVPRFRDILRLPETGEATPEEVLALIAGLEPGRLEAASLPPLLELAVRLERPSPELRQQVEAALAERPVRLARLGVRYQGQDRPRPERPLQDLAPEEILELCWRASYPGEPPEELRRAFLELLEQVRGQGVGP
jgi:exonuclease SbcD